MKLIKKIALTLTLSSALFATDIALIKTFSPQEATGEVAKVYQEMNASWKMIPNPLKLYSNNPEMLRHKWDSFKFSSNYKNIDDKLQAMIRMLVSIQHDCEYCVGFNEGFLINSFKIPAADVMAMKKDPSLAPLDEKQKALLLFVLKATKDSKSTTKEDITNLKKLGWSDAEIFFTTNYAAQMVAVDILINAFKVQVDY
jgi:alkylhydroperoxidase family enzyme